MLAETVTGFVGQILDEGEFDEHTHKLLQKLYNIALKEMEEGDDDNSSPVVKFEEINIIIKGGLLTNVYSSNKNILVNLIDLDDFENEEENKKQLEHCEKTQNSVW